MLAPNTSGTKYTTVHRPISDAELRAHLRGVATFAAPLIGADGRARAICVELDTDGIDGAKAALDAAAMCGLRAFSIATPGAGTHNGSHTWLLYQDFHDPARLRAQSEQLLILMQRPVREVYPSKANIRLPFGLHLWTKTRGTLLLQSGELFNLDAADELRAAGRAVLELPLNTTPPPPPAPLVDYHKPRAQHTSGDERPGEAFNRACSPGEVAKMLECKQWARTAQKGEVVYFARPGKRGGHSATLGWCEERNVLTVFSSSDSLLPNVGGKNGQAICTKYTPFAVYTHLFHSGRFADAAKDLYGRGYGKEYQAKVQR